MYSVVVCLVALAIQLLTFGAAVPVVPTNSTVSLNSTSSTSSNPRIGTLECYPVRDPTKGPLKLDCLNALLGFDQDSTAVTAGKYVGPSLNEYGRCSLTAGFYPQHGSTAESDVTTSAFIYQGFMMMIEGCAREKGRVDMSTIRIGKEGNILLHLQKLPRPEVGKATESSGNVTAVT